MSNKTRNHPEAPDDDWWTGAVIGLIFCGVTSPCGRPTDVQPRWPKPGLEPQTGTAVLHTRGASQSPAMENTASSVFDQEIDRNVARVRVHVAEAKPLSPRRSMGRNGQRKGTFARRTRLSACWSVSAIRHAGCGRSPLGVGRSHCFLHCSCSPGVVTGAPWRLGCEMQTALGRPSTFVESDRMKVTALDHVVLVVADVARTCAFYERALGMRTRRAPPRPVGAPIRSTQDQFAGGR